MKQLKKTILTLVALLAVTTGAWAKTDPNSVYWDNQTWSGWADSETTHTVGDITITCSGNAKAYESTMSGEPLALQAGANDAITFTSNGKPFKSIKIQLDDNSDPGIAGWTWVGSWTIEWSGTPSTSVTLSGCDIKADVITFTFGSATAVDIDWNAATKTGTFTQPAGNVVVVPEYYPQATLTAAPTAADGAKATTDDLLVSGGTVATITGSDPAAPQGTLMYYVSTSTMTTEALLALDADKWVAEPTAAGITQKCGAFVYYYVKGNDSTDDALNFSDGDISSANVLNVPIFPAPLWNAEFDLTNAPEADKADGIWKTDITGEGVVKGTPVTVTYTGSKKVLGVKAEKKAAVPATITVTWNNNDITGSGNSFTKGGVTITAGMIDFEYKTFYDGGTFTTTLGNFTKIEVTGADCGASGTGWSGSTWTGNASSVSYSGNIMGFGNTGFVFTIVPTN